MNCISMLILIFVLFCLDFQLFLLSLLHSKAKWKGSRDHLCLPLWRSLANKSPSKYIHGNCIGIHNYFTDQSNGTHHLYDIVKMIYYPRDNVGIGDVKTMCRYPFEIPCFFHTTVILPLCCETFVNNGNIYYYSNFSTRDLYKIEHYSRIE